MTLGRLQPQVHDQRVVSPIERQQPLGEVLKQDVGIEHAWVGGGGGGGGFFQ